MINQIRCIMTIWDDLHPCKKLLIDQSFYLKNFPLETLLINFYIAISSMRWCFYLIGMQKDQLPGILGLTLIPSKRDRALRGLKALSVLSDLIGPRSE